MPNNISLRALIEKRLEQRSIEISVISDALNFVGQSPAEVITRFLHEVAADSVQVGRPMFEAQVAEYRRNPTPEVRQTMGLTLLADAILETEATLETKATPEECAAALHDLGLLASEEVVRSIASVLEIKKNFHSGEHVPVREKTAIPTQPPPARVAPSRPQIPGLQFLEPMTDRPTVPTEFAPDHMPEEFVPPIFSGSRNQTGDPSMVIRVLLKGEPSSSDTPKPLPITFGAPGG